MRIYLNPIRSLRSLLQIIHLGGLAWLVVRLRVWCEPSANRVLHHIRADWELHVLDAGIGPLHREALN